MPRSQTPILEKSMRWLRAAAAACCVFSVGVSYADNLLSPADLTRVRELAEQGDEERRAARASLLGQANRDWRWGSVSGEFEARHGWGKRSCAPSADRGQTKYLKEGAPDAYAKILAFHLSGELELAVEARERVLDLVDTYGFELAGGRDYSGSNQCILELGISIPVWVETASLLESSDVWGQEDRLAFARWLAKEVYPKVARASRARRNNWGAAGSLSASIIARHVDGIVPQLTEEAPEKRSLSPSQAAEEHDAMQLARIQTSWRGDSRCKRYGIQVYGGIPDELRRGATGCDGSFLESEKDASHTYHTMHVELLVFHAEVLRRVGDPSFFEIAPSSGPPAILQSILFVIDNPSSGGRSWPWGSRTGSLILANRHYEDERLARAIETAETFRGGRALPYARLAP